MGRHSHSRVVFSFVNKPEIKSDNFRNGIAVYYIKNDKF